MDVHINCPHCNGTLSIKHEWLGMGMNCPLCNQYFDTEAPAASVVPAPVQAPVPLQEQEAPAKLQVKKRPPAGQKPKKKKLTVSRTGMRKKSVMKKKSDLPHYPGAARERQAKRDALRD